MQIDKQISVCFDGTVHPGRNKKIPAKPEDNLLLIRPRLICWNQNKISDHAEDCIRHHASSLISYILSNTERLHMIQDIPLWRDENSMVEL